MVIVDERISFIVPVKWSNKPKHFKKGDCSKKVRELLQNYNKH